MTVKSEKFTLVALCALAAIHTAVTLLLALTRLYSYKASLLDIGTFDQLLWNLIHHGVPLSTTNPPFTTEHWLGFHFSPLLLAFAPLYSVWPHIEALQLIQSFCFAFAAIPLFFAARALGAGYAETWACALIYWVNPFVVSAAVWDFHEIAFSTFLIATALWAFCAQRFTAMLVALALLLLTKEHYGVSVAGFGFLWGWHHKDWKRGGVVMLAGAMAAYIIIAVIMPLFHGGAHPMFNTIGNHLSRYGWLSAPWHEKFSTFFALMFGDGTPQITGLDHLFLLFFSCLLMPLFAPFYLAPAGADMLANLLSANPMQRHIASYHAAACIPVFIIAGLQGYRWLGIWRPAMKKSLVALALAMFVALPASGIMFFPITIWELHPFTTTHDGKPVEDIKILLGTEPVVAQANIGMFFSQRSEIYPYPNKLEKTQFVVLHLFQPFANPASAHFGIPYGEETTQEYTQRLSNFLMLADWHIEYWNKPWLVMKRGKAKQDEAVQRTEIRSAIADMIK